MPALRCSVRPRGVCMQPAAGAARRAAAALRPGGGAGAAASALRAFRLSAAAAADGADAPEVAAAEQRAAAAPARRSAPPPRPAAAASFGDKWRAPRSTAAPPASAAADDHSAREAPASQPARRDGAPLAAPPPGEPLSAMFDRRYSGPPAAQPSPLLPPDAATLCMRAVDAGQQWANLQSAADLLEEGKKSTLAALTEYHMAAGLSKAASENKALCEPEYTDYLVRITEARHKALTAKIQYEALKKEQDLVRTFEATRRAETQLQ